MLGKVKSMVVSGGEVGARQRPGGGRGGGRDRVLSCRPGELCIWCNMVNNCALWFSMVHYCPNCLSRT